MGPEDADGIWTPGELVMHTLRRSQSAALEVSYRCLTLLCLYEDHSVQSCNSTSTCGQPEDRGSNVKLNCVTR
jgi:hypothetical protein